MVLINPPPYRLGTQSLSFIGKQAKFVVGT
jgi:hypothetical protein